MVNTASQNRVESLRSRLTALGADAFIVRSTSDIYWLTAFDGVFDEEQAHALVVTPQAAVLHTDSRYAQACREAASASGSSVAASLADGSRIAIQDTITLAEFRRLKAETEAKGQTLVETTGEVVCLRGVKDAAEIARLEAAQAITDAAFDHIRTFIRIGMTEREVQLELEDYMVRHGAQRLAFASIVATGANGAKAHAIPGATRLEAGQCVVLDFGAKADGYCSDMTRMIFLGKPSAQLRDAYTALRASKRC